MIPQIFTSLDHLGDRAAAHAVMSPCIQSSLTLSPCNVPRTACTRTFTSTTEVGLCYLAVRGRSFSEEDSCTP